MDTWTTECTDTLSKVCTFGREMLVFPFIFASDLFPAKKKPNPADLWHLRYNEDCAGSPAKPSNRTQSGQLNSSSPSLLPALPPGAGAELGSPVERAREQMGEQTKVGSAPSFISRSRWSGRSQGGGVAGHSEQRADEATLTHQGCTVHQVSGLLGRAVPVKWAWWITTIFSTSLAAKIATSKRTMKKKGMKSKISDQNWVDVFWLARRIPDHQFFLCSAFMCPGPPLVLSGQKHSQWGGPQWVQGHC